LSIIIKDHYSINKLPWLIVLVIEPFTGLFLFLTFGRDYKDSNRYQNRPLAHPKQYLTHEPKTNFSEIEYRSIDSEITDIFKTAYNMTGHHTYSNNTLVRVLRNGENFFPNLMDSLASATSYIFMQFFIIRTDETGRRVFQILSEKAKDGVEVFLLYDALGSAFLDKSVLKRLKDSGVKIAAIDPIRIGFFDTRVNYRNHRKIVIVDGKIGYLGGMNLANEYWNKSKRYPPFRDTAIRIEGSAINSLTALFFRDWYSATGKFKQSDSYYKAPLKKAVGLVQIVPSGPEYSYPPIRNLYVKMINNAKRSIKIMTPYLVPDNELITSLIIASRGGVDISIIVPGIPDKKYVYMITKSFFEELMNEGIKIYTMNNTFTHAKILIIDDQLASVGTYNLDHRSARINFEATALLYRQGVKELVDDFAQDLKLSTQVDLQVWKKRGVITRIIEGTLALFSPFV
jgi:cardiolipin synthase